MKNINDREIFILEKSSFTNSYGFVDHFENFINILIRRNKQIFIIDDSCYQPEIDGTNRISEEEVSSKVYSSESSVIITGDENKAEKWKVEGFVVKKTNEYISLLRELLNINQSEEWIITVDLDGTLLDSKDVGVYDDVIDSKNISLIKEIISLGHKFIISTGRSWNETQVIYDMLEQEQVVIQCAGAHVHIPGKETIFSSPVKKDVLINMHNYINEKFGGVIALIYADEEKTIFHEFKESNLRIRLKSLKDVVEVDDETFIKDNYKGSFMFDPLVTDCDEVKRALEFKFPEYHWFFTGNRQAGFVGIEYNQKEITKATAIERVSKHFGIPMDRTIAIGDGPNDLEAIMSAAIGISVLNADSEVKFKSDVISRTNNDEMGVGLILHDLLNF